MKTFFLEFANRVCLTEKGILKIEKAFGDICLREHDICALSNKAGYIALAILGFKKIDEYDLFFDSFMDDFWGMVDNGSITIEIYHEDADNEEIHINSWEEFYDYYKKVSEEYDD